MASETHGGRRGAGRRRRGLHSGRISTKRLEPSIYMSDPQGCLGRLWDARRSHGGRFVYNDWLTPRGGPDLRQTPGGPRGSGSYRGKRGRLSRILAVCAQLDLRGDCAASALGSVGAAWHRMWKKKEKCEEGALKVCRRACKFDNARRNN